MAVLFFFLRAHAHILLSNSTLSQFRIKPQRVREIARVKSELPLHDRPSSVNNGKFFTSLSHASFVIEGEDKRRKIPY